jgi:hypothetical protein
VIEQAGCEVDFLNESGGRWGSALCSHHNDILLTVERDKPPLPHITYQVLWVLSSEIGIESKVGGSQYLFLRLPEPLVKEVDYPQPQGGVQGMG